MGRRGRARARRPVWLAILLAVAWVLLAGAEVAVPALALVVLVHVGTRLLAWAAREEPIAHPDLAVVIAVNATVVLLVQALLAIEGAG